jgi:hypothetical protein
MAYIPRWERLPAALKRVMDATRLSKDEAQKDICLAIADRAINIQGKLGKHVSTGFTSWDTVLEGQAFIIPTEIKPEDLDWERSRPEKSWTVRREAFKKAGAWELDLIELCRADVTNALCTGRPGESVQHVPGETGATNTSRSVPEGNAIGPGSSSSDPQSPGAEGSPRPRGPRPKKLAQTCDAMRDDVQQGRRSMADLKNMLEKDLSVTYGVSRDTARKARSAVLSELGGN